MIRACYCHSPPRNDSRVRSRNSADILRTSKAVNKWPTMRSGEFRNLIRSWKSFLLSVSSQNRVHFEWALIHLHSTDKSLKSRSWTLSLVTQTAGSCPAEVHYTLLTYAMDTPCGSRLKLDFKGNPIPNFKWSMVLVALSRLKVPLPLLIYSSPVHLMRSLDEANQEPPMTEHSFNSAASVVVDALQCTVCSVPRILLDNILKAPLISV